MTNVEIQQLHKDAVVSLSYVNPGIEYKKGGGVSARTYFTKRERWMEATIPMMRKGGVDLVVLSHGNPDPSRLPGAAGADCLLRCFDAMIQEIERNRDLALILTRRDLDEALRRGKMGIIFGVTCGPVDGDLATLRTLFRVGVRTAHPFGNDPKLGGSADGPKQHGLTRVGQAIIREMERLGMLVDLAHSNDRTFAEALRFAQKPVMDSHTNCRAIADYERCCTDDQLRIIARQGGVIGVHFGFVETMARVEDARYKRMMRAFRKKYAAMGRKYKDPYEFMSHRWDPAEWPRSLGGSVDDGTVIHRATIRQLGDHIERMVNVAGIDHVCIGSDYSSGCMPEGVETAETLVNLTHEMAQRGFSAAEIKKIWGGNFVRLLRETLPA